MFVSQVIISYVSVYYLLKLQASFVPAVRIGDGDFRGLTFIHCGLTSGHAVDYVVAVAIQHICSGFHYGVFAGCQISYRICSVCKLVIGHYFSVTIRAGYCERNLCFLLCSQVSIPYCSDKGFSKIQASFVSAVRIGDSDFRGLTVIHGSLASGHAVDYAIAVAIQHICSGFHYGVFAGCQISYRICSVCKLIIGDYFSVIIRAGYCERNPCFLFVGQVIIGYVSVNYFLKRQASFFLFCLICKRKIRFRIIYFCKSIRFDITVFKDFCDRRIF